MAPNLENGEEEREGGTRENKEWWPLAEGVKFADSMNEERGVLPHSKKDAYYMLMQPPSSRRQTPSCPP